MRYRYFITDTKVICVSSYAGKGVRGIAKCDPKDTFNIDIGKELAGLRCDKKIAEKRAVRSRDKLQEAMNELIAAEAKVARMREYHSEAINELAVVDKKLADLEARI